MGLGIDQLKNLIIATTGRKVQKEASLKTLFAAQSQDSTALTSVDLKISQDDAKLQALENDIAAAQADGESAIGTATIEAETRSYSLNKFVASTGMCSMGMGMGDANSYSNSSGAITLTADEVTALSDAFADIGSSQETMADNTADILKELNGETAGTGTLPSGTVASSKTVNITDPKTGKEVPTLCIELTRSDGSKTQIVDANGNGAMDTKDYSFNDALTQIDNTMKALAAKITEINTATDAKVAKIQEAEQPIIADKESNTTVRDNLDAKISQRLTEIAAAQTEIIGLDGYITTSELSLASLEHQAEAEEAQEAAQSQTQETQDDETAANQTRVNQQVTS